MADGPLLVILAFAAAASILGGGVTARYLKLPYWKGSAIMAAATAGFAIVAIAMDDLNPALCWIAYLAAAFLTGRYALDLTFGQTLRIVLGTMILVLLVLVGYRLLFAGAFT
ncbi:MAG: hypothetical protein WBA44_03140 [Mesorhizobium sp.]